MDNNNLRLWPITNSLCQALQSCSQDIFNAINLVFSIKSLLKQLRNGGWSNLLEKVKCVLSKAEMFLSMFLCLES